MSRYLISALALAAALAPSASFAGTGDASYSINIRGFVPVICHASLQSATVSLPQDGSPVSLGSVSEFCNNPTGYRVVVSYTGSGDLGSLIVDGQHVQLNSSGQAVIETVQGPAFHTTQLDYQPGADAITSLQVSIEAT